jgi:hypothetical protein
VQQDNTNGDDDDETALCFGLLVESVSPSTIWTYIAHLQQINKIPSDDFTFKDLFPDGVKPGLLTDMQVRNLLDIIVYRDRNNNDVEWREAIQYIMEISGCGSRKTAENHVDYLICSKRFPNLKRDGRIVKAQATTTKCSPITIAQQFCWHCFIDDVWADQAQRNQPCKDFDKLKEHFMGNLDETGVGATESCLNIIGEKEMKKQEKNTDNSRESITAVHTGNAAGNEGPYIFLAKGKKMECKSLRPNALREKGALAGSRVIMTPSAYTNDEAWMEMAPYLADGIQDMPVVQDCPNWWFVLCLNGFSSHISIAAAHSIFYEHKILLVKEEGDTSHRNQPTTTKLLRRQTNLTCVNSLILLVQRQAS